MCLLVHRKWSATKSDSLFGNDLTILTLLKSRAPKAEIAGLVVARFYLTLTRLALTLS